MKTDKVFNTVFETSLRILLLLDESDSDLDEQAIRTADFMATYGKEFKISNDSPNGDNPYFYCELASRKVLVYETLKQLVVDGNVLPTATEDGFLYRATLPGHHLAQSLESDYAKEYRAAVGSALFLIRKTGVDSIVAMMKTRSRDAIDVEYEHE